MILTIDFLNRVVYIQSATIKDTQSIEKIIKAYGDDPALYQISSLIDMVEFDNDNTGGVEVKYQTKKDVN